MNSVMKYLSEHQGYLTDITPIYIKLNELIEMEIAEQPMWVGKPIDVSVIIRNGFR